MSRVLYRDPLYPEPDVAHETIGAEPMVMPWGATPRLPGVVAERRIFYLMDLAVERSRFLGVLLAKEGMR